MNLPFRTRDIALSACPTWGTLTLSGDVVTFRTIFACTFECTSWSIAAIDALMFTSQPNVTGLAHILTGHMITRFITEYYIRTLLFAACKMLFNEIKTI